MTSAQFESHEFVLVPLSPIHVGGGEEAQWLPEDYRLSGDRRFIERVSVRAVLSRLDPKLREDVIRKLDTDLKGFIRELQNCASDKEIAERIVISDQSARDIDLDSGGRGRRNEIDGFYRSGGRPTLPGSSLKGALRTAWLRTLWELKARQTGGHAPLEMPPLAEWQRMRPRGRDSRAAKARELEQILLDLASGKQATDTDPLRDLAVADAPLSPDATRIDKVVAWKRGRDGYGFDATKMQMHRERLRAVLDGGTPPAIPITIGLRARKVRELRARIAASGKAVPKRSIETAGFLLAALELQHAELWQRELEKFFEGGNGERLRQALDVFKDFSRGGKDPEAALVRLGWASHAEAKSLAAVRRVERPQAKGDARFSREGSSRHVIDLNGHPMPFGWALLIRKDAWERKAPKEFLAPPDSRNAAVASARAGTSRPAAGRGETVLGGQVLYAKGTKVLVGGEEAVLHEDVTHAHKPSEEIMADFGDGPEPVRVDEIEGPAE